MNKNFLLCGFVVLDDVPHFAEKRFDCGLGRLDEQFPFVFANVFAQEVKAVVNVSNNCFLLGKL